MELLKDILDKNNNISLERCHVCGELTGTIQNLFGQDKVYPRACKCKREATLAKEKKQKALQRQIRLEQLFNNSLMSKDFKTKTFSSWDHRLGNPSMLDIGIKFTENFNSIEKENMGILFCGAPGVGKTHLTACIANELIRKDVPCVCVNVIDLLERIKSSFNTWGNEGVSQILNGLDNADLLILDDLGAENQTNWSKSTIYEIIDHRYRKNKLLMITTNLSLSSLKETYDERTMDRIYEMCSKINFAGNESIRISKGKAKQNKLADLLF